MIVEGIVDRIDTRTLDDGFIVTLVRVSASRVLRGNVPSGKITLGLPGAYVEGQWVGALGLQPDIETGDTLLLFGDIVDAENVQMVGGQQSVFKIVADASGAAIAADFDGNPIVDPGCTEDRIISRPVSEMPGYDELEANDLVALSGVTSESPIEPAGLVFADVATDLGLPWDAFEDALETCIATQPAGPGALTAVGGGW